MPKGKPRDIAEVIDVDANSLQQEFSLEWPKETGTLDVELDESICGPGGCNPPNLWSDDQRIYRAFYPGEDNKIHLEDLPVGKYYLADKDTRDAPRVLEFSVNAGETTDLSLTADSYTPQPSMLGMIVVRCYTEEGIPIIGCEVTIAGESGKVQRSSAQNGRQVFVGDPGDYVMTATFPGYETINRKVSVIQVAPDGRAVGDFGVDVRLASAE